MTEKLSFDIIELMPGYIDYIDSAFDIIELMPGYVNYIDSAFDAAGC